MNRDAEVAVIGLGAFGSATLWRLAQRGIHTIGFEQYEPAHPFGSSHGKTRLFRTISHDVPELYPLSMLARQLWSELERSASEAVFVETGGVAVSPPGGRIESSVLAIHHRFNLDPVRMPARELASIHRAFRTVPDDSSCFIDPHAGVLFPEIAIRAACQQAEQLGAQIHLNTKVESIASERNEVVVHTAEKSYSVDKVILCTGAWSSKFLPAVPISVERIPQTWFDWKSGGSPDLNDMPVFQLELPDGSGLWGHGAVSDETHAKIGTTGNPLADRRVSIEHVDRMIVSADLAYLRELTGKAFPDVNLDPVEASVCLLTTPPDAQFVLGPTRDDRVLAGFGGSAKGFKQASAIGEVLARYTAGQEIPFPVDFMSPQRFS